ncbi:putative Nicotinamide-nucleotide adenylyltransferase [Pseudomonas syringae pv. cerasicola]|uniref:Putative Nicotinamide-nucleotide adenylyltransferase n=1 Tax=Pseudomonas syringae pv. cerasicola TaxID=264451 RepID=A0A0N8R408_PSESX|nr:putative Nicotinamide-nucleotide adenylyltransferase [Pseudomonas syringae pv. cerasicola]RMS70590.1 putative Nicotinamide-nucleotide adenylyltransferase [Pseudomonas savastanoi]
MKVLVLTGPESSGKSWLSAEIQNRFGGLLVGEYVRHFIDQQGRDTHYADIPAIARGQLDWEDTARASEPHLLILDTHLLSNVLWSRTLFGDCPAWIEQQTTCTCCCRPRAWTGSATGNAASRSCANARPSSTAAGNGWTTIGRPIKCWAVTGRSAASRR